MVTTTHLQYHQLTDEEINNPVNFISSFFELECGLMDFREEISNLIKSASSNKKCGDRDNYFFNYRCLLKFLEAGHILYDRKESFSLRNHPSLKKVNSDTLSLIYKQLKTDLRLLSFNEMDDTMIFFEAFFKFQHINEWRLTFSRFAEYAYRHCTIDEVLENGSQIILLKDYTEKLIEMMYFIYHLHSKKGLIICNSQIN